MVNIRQLTKSAREDGNALADWLNDKTVPAPARIRVAAIARDLATLSANAKRVFMRVPTRQSLAMVLASGIPRDTLITDERVRAMFEWETRDAGVRDFDGAAYLRAAKALRGYKFCPYINLVRRARNIHAFPAQLVPDGWSQIPTVGNAEFGNWPTSADKKRGPAKEQEAWMVLLIMGLSSAGAMARLRECECGRWFFASRPEKRHCSEICRKDAYRPSAEQKEHRRKYMREYMKAYNREQFPGRKQKGSKNKQESKAQKERR